MTHTTEANMMNDTTELDVMPTPFEGRELTTIIYRGRPCWVAKQVGEAMGYADPRKLANSIRQRWTHLFREERDYTILRGRELRDFKQLIPLEPNLGSSEATSMMLLFESGMHLAAAKTDQPIGVRLLHFLADEVLPQLARDGRYSPDRSVVDGQIVTDLNEQAFDARMQEVRYIGERAYHICRSLAAMVGLFDQRWLQNTARHQLALMEGRAVNDTDASLTVSGYLGSKGLSKSQVGRHQAAFGKLVKGFYESQYGEEPPKRWGYAGGAPRAINSYYEEHRALFDEAWTSYARLHDLEDRQLQLVV